MQVQELAVLKGTVPVAAGRGRGRGASSGAMRGGPFPGQGKAARHVRSCQEIHFMTFLCP